MSGIPLQTEIVYGPILSRRLGRSLGINLLGTERKVCSFNCIYCQYGHAKVSDSCKDNPSFPSTAQILTEVENALKKPRTIDFLTFSGNGEPTLHPDFPTIVQGVKSLRDKMRPDARLAILSNSSGVIQPGIVSALQNLDAPMMKLDAGDEQTFNAINRPAQSSKFWDTVEGLRKLPKLIIQSLLFDGEISNVQEQPFTNWVKVLKDINPEVIHIYSVARPTADAGVIPIFPKKLQEIETELINEYDLPVKAFWS